MANTETERLDELHFPLVLTHLRKEISGMLALLENVEFLSALIISMHDAGMKKLKW